ncbi:uncharacterized protein LOC134679556 [Cydia fagiglandana]|uniref:uncharacterized protein LOC134679556 n=1 Tax=Cydia fagiglandana TaxID=1458189 RepID=UPI002FEE5C07
MGETTAPSTTTTTPPTVSVPRTMDSTVNAVGVKVPPFWPEEPALWFAQLEGQFSLANIVADSTKFYHVVSNLEHKYAAEVKDIITKPPATEKYDKLKTELVYRLSVSKDKRVEELVSQAELGNRKPSQFLRHLRDLAGTDLSDDFLRSIWAKRLPPHVQTVIATMSDATLDKVAALADRVNDIVVHTPHVAEASGSAVPVLVPSSVPSTMEERLNRRIDDLVRQVAALATGNSRGRATTRSRSRGRHSSRSRSRAGSSGRCWYHDRFGPRATKCRAPCSWTEGNASGGH